MNTGDVFRWNYKNPSEHMPYHCCSQIAEFDGKRLRDTYWSSLGDGRSWTPEEAAVKLELRFVANLADLEPADPSALDYYAKHDVVDLRHANNSSRSNVYLRKGAKRSRDVMEETLMETIRESEREIRWARDRIERCRVLLERMNSEPLENIYVLSIRPR